MDYKVKKISQHIYKVEVSFVGSLCVSSLQPCSFMLASLAAGKIIDQHKKKHFPYD